MKGNQPVAAPKRSLAELEAELVQLKKDFKTVDKLLVDLCDSADDKTYAQLEADLDLFEEAIADYKKRIQEAKKARKNGKS